MQHRNGNSNMVRDSIRLWKRHSCTKLYDGAGGSAGGGTVCECQQRAITVCEN